MRRMLTAAVGTMLSVFAAGAWAQGDAQAAGVDEWGKLIAANNLYVNGNSPFHLEITFQLYDLDGNATTKGTVEDWWAAPGSERVIVHLAGVNEDGSLAVGASHELVRDRFLVNELLNLAVHPVPEEPAAGGRVKNEKLSLGKVNLYCLGPESHTVSGSWVQYESVCTQPQAELVLISRGYSGDQILARQATGMFQGTHVALKLQLAFLGRTAITGEVTKLQSFDAAKPEVTLLSLLPEQEVIPNGPMHTGHTRAVVFGKHTATVEPELPSGHQEGKAITNTVIGKDGAVVDVAPIACSDAAFCAAAVRVFGQWKFSPSLLKGQPTEVNITNSIEVTRDTF